jgi:hypothetical protein
MMDFISNGEKTIAIDLETTAIPVEYARAICEAKQREKLEAYNKKIATLVKAAISHINEEFMNGKIHASYLFTPYNADISRDDALKICHLIETEFKDKGYWSFIYEYAESNRKKYASIDIAIPEEK